MNILHKTILFSMLLAATLFCLYPQDSIYFAVGTEGLDPFSAMFQNGHFVPLVDALANPQMNHKKKLAETLRQFPVQKRVMALGESGSFFFLFDRKTGKILRAHFGHPEWTVMSPDSVINIQPRMFFRIADFPAPYLLVDFSYGWESRGFAIINMASGYLEALTTY